jgi:hypothetical protein
LFDALIVNPLWAKLAGPCARRDNYYIKKRASQSLDCSRRCGDAATAVNSTRERNKKARNDKLRRARVGIRPLSQSRFPPQCATRKSGS